MAAADTLARLLAAFDAHPPIAWRVIRNLEAGDLRALDDGDVTEQMLIDWGERVLERATSGDYTWTRAIALRAIAIDAWYAPVNVGAPRAGRVGRDLLRLIDEGRLNEDPGLGSVIPKSAEWGRVIGDADTVRPNWLEHCCRTPNPGNSLMHNVVWLPPHLPADDADGGHSGARQVKVRFRRLPARLRMPDGDLTIGFAPLGELYDDVGLNLPPERDGRRWYDIRLAEFGSRVEAALDKLRAKKVQIAIFPETTVTPANLAVIKANLRANPGGGIELVVAGVTTPPAVDGGYSRNHVVLLDRRGNELHTHDKLMRWNLTADERSWYGFAPGMDPGERLYENIDPTVGDPASGGLVEVVEIPGLGRVMTLICADIGAREPWNWIRRNVLLDWTFAPILDSTMLIGRWMGKGGERAARFARSRVVIINSVSLQALYGRVKGAPTAKSCAALLMDGRETPVVYHACDLPLDGSSDMADAVSWDHRGWPEVLCPDCAACTDYCRPAAARP